MQERGVCLREKERGGKERVCARWARERSEKGSVCVRERGEEGKRE